MCLNKISEKKIAKKDLIVYKHITKVEEEDNVIYITPYQKTPVKFNILYKSDIKFEISEEEQIIHKALHSYVNKKDVIQEAKYWNLTCDDFESEIIVKCMIPKNSEFYTGQFDGKKSIASNQLMYLEIIQ